MAKSKKKSKSDKVEEPERCLQEEAAAISMMIPGDHGDSRVYCDCSKCCSAKALAMLAAG